MRYMEVQSVKVFYFDERDNLCIKKNTYFNIKCVKIITIVALNSATCTYV